MAEGILSIGRNWSSEVGNWRIDRNLVPGVLEDLLIVRETLILSLWADILTVSKLTSLDAGASHNRESILNLINVHIGSLLI